MNSVLHIAESRYVMLFQLHKLNKTTGSFGQHQSANFTEVKFICHIRTGSFQGGKFGWQKQAGSIHRCKCDCHKSWLISQKLSLAAIKLDKFIYDQFGCHTRISLFHGG
jgi:hypothetical protein